MIVVVVVVAVPVVMVVVGGDGTASSSSSSSSNGRYRVLICMVAGRCAPSAGIAAQQVLVEVLKID